MNIDKLRRIMIGLCVFFALMAFSVGHFFMGGIALIVAFGIKSVYSGSYNNRNAYDKQVADAADLTLMEVYEAIKDIETPLGRAYMGGHETYGDRVIILGPGIFKDYIVIYKENDSILLHSTCAIHNLHVDEARFEHVLDTANLEVTTKRFSSFVSYKVITSVLLNDLADIIEGVKNGVQPEITEMLDFTMYHYDSSDYIVRDIEDNEYAICRTFLKPLSVTIYDMDGGVVSTVDGDVKKMKEGFKCVMSGVDYGTFYRRTMDAHDQFVINTPDGTFTATAFRAVEDGRISCNYRVQLDGVDKAVVVASKKVEFEQHGFVENDVICSFDDDYLAFYITLLDFIMGVNHFTRH